MFCSLIGEAENTFSQSFNLEFVSSAADIHVDVEYI